MGGGGGGGAFRWGWESDCHVRLRQYVHSSLHNGDFNTTGNVVDNLYVFPSQMGPMSGTHKRVCDKSKRNTSVVCVHTVTTKTDDDESGYVSVVKEVMQTFCTLR